MRFLDIINPLIVLLPEIESPKRKIAFREKILWTVVILFIFLVLCQVPLYGIRVSGTDDPLYWLRVLTASNRETLMELGISPIVTSGMVLQLIVGSNLISYDPNNKEDSAMFQGVQKLVGLLITFGQAVAYVSSGMYGDVRSLGLGNCTLIVMQLFITGVIVILLDEMMQKGYGVGSGISLFIASNICENIVWKSLSPTKISTENGAEFEGAITAFFHLLFTRQNKLAALREAFLRKNLPNMFNLFATICVFVVVIYFQGFRVEIPIKHQQMRAKVNSYPIKLFYTSNIPIILQTALISNLYFVSKFMYKNFPDNVIIRLFGVWETSKDSHYTIPVWGLAYYLSPPPSILDMLKDPIHTLFYLTFILASAAIFSRIWVDVSGSSPKDVAKQLANEKMCVAGYRESNTISVLKRYIPIAAGFGGMCIGALTIFADYTGAIGSGTGILLVVTIIFQYFEYYAKEQQKEGGNLFTMLRS